SLYKITLKNQGSIEKVSFAEQKEQIFNAGDYSKDRSKKVFVKDGALILYNSKNNSTRHLVELGDRISDPEFLMDGNRVSFVFNNNIYVYHINNGSLEKVTNLRSGEKQDRDPKLDTKDDWVKIENVGLLEVVRQREE